eukprot:UN01249
MNATPHQAASRRGKPKGKEKSKIHSIINTKGSVDLIELELLSFPAEGLASFFHLLWGYGRRQRQCSAKRRQTKPAINSRTVLFFLFHQINFFYLIEKRNEG